MQLSAWSNSKNLEGQLPVEHANYIPPEDTADYNYDEEDDDEARNYDYSGDGVMKSGSGDIDDSLYEEGGFGRRVAGDFRKLRQGQEDDYAAIVGMLKEEDQTDDWEGGYSIGDDDDNETIDMKVELTDSERQMLDEIKRMEKDTLIESGGLEPEMGSITDGEFD